MTHEFAGVFFLIAASAAAVGLFGLCVALVQL